MNNSPFQIRLSDQEKANLQAEALSRGLSMAALIKERLAIGQTLPPHISGMLDRYAKFIGADHAEILRRIIVAHFAMLEAGIQLTGQPDGLLAQMPFAKFDRPLSESELFEYMLLNFKKALKAKADAQAENQQPELDLVPAGEKAPWGAAK
jgi:hypothetical protein